MGLLHFQIAGLIAPLLPPLLFCGCRSFSWRTNFSEDFSSYRGRACVPDGGRIGPWSVDSTGFGCVEVSGDSGDRWLQARPQASAPGSTHAFLVTGPRFKAPFSYSVRASTIEQLRIGARPNAWEAAWLVWGYADRDHFYYFIPKPGGWELGKRDPGYRGGQRFLDNGSSPAFPLGSWADITITQDAENTISVYSEGRLVTTVTDFERPYVRGRIGLYGEDCSVRFKGISVEPTTR
jgi:hypothetical protein